MRVCIGYNKVVVTTETGVIHFDLPKVFAIICSMISILS